jgi:hypothetical protein
MFELSLFDHLRMTFGHVAYRHKAHVRLAESRARAGRWLRGIEAGLVAGVLMTALSAAFTGRRAYVIACAVFAIAALATLLFRLAFDLEASARAHAACATRLWHVRERYRAAMSDLSDGAIDLDGARRRRDELLDELRKVYESAPPAEHRAFEAAGRAAATDAALTDEEIDSLLPASLQKSRRPAA